MFCVKLHYNAVKKLLEILEGVGTFYKSFGSTYALKRQILAYKKWKQKTPAFLLFLFKALVDPNHCIIQDSTEILQMYFLS